MATIKRFEDLECWKNGREICKKIKDVINTTPLSNDYKLKEQINGSSGSIMDNIAEGFGRMGNKEFINFLTYSAGSANECQSQLYRILDRNYITEQVFTEIYELIGVTRAQIIGLIGYLQKCEAKGVKFMK